MSVGPGYYQRPPSSAPNRRRENGVLALIVVVALIPALWFALQPSARTRSPERPPGVAYEAFPVRVTFGTAMAADEVGPLVAVKGWRYVVVQVTATNVSDRFILSSVAATMFSASTPGLLNPETGEPANGQPVHPVNYRGDDGPNEVPLAPGVESALMLVWLQSRDTPAPATLTIQVSTMEWVPSTVQDGWTWRTDRQVAQTTLAVGQG